VLPNTLEDGLIKEKEWFTIIGAVVYTNGFTLDTGTNRDVSIALSPERSTLEIRFAVQVCPPVSERCERGGFREELIGSPGYKGLELMLGGGGLTVTFVRTMMKKAKTKQRKEESKGSARGNYGVRLKKPRKPYSRRKTQKTEVLKMVVVPSRHMFDEAICAHFMYI